MGASFVICTHSMNRMLISWHVCANSSFPASPNPIIYRSQSSYSRINRGGFTSRNSHTLHSHPDLHPGGVSLCSQQDWLQHSLLAVCLQFSPLSDLSVLK